MKKIITIASALFFASTLFAQEQSDLVTDRPDMAESSITVPHRTLQIETGAFFEKKESADFEYTAIAYNSTLLRYGLLKNLELRFGIEYGESSVLSKAFNTESKLQGMQALSMGVKINISEQDGIIPEMALLSHLAIPNTGLSEFQTETLTPDIILAMTYSISDKLSAGANFGAEWSDGSSKASGLYAVVVGFGLGEKTGVYLESFGNFAKDEDVQSTLDGGITYLILPKFQILCLSA